MRMQPSRWWSAIRTEGLIQAKQKCIKNHGIRYDKLIIVCIEFQNHLAGRSYVFSLHGWIEGWDQRLIVSIVENRWIQKDAIKHRQKII